MYQGVAANQPGLARELSTARAQLASQERQIQELNHRIANSLQLAADMLVFEQLRARDPLAQAALEASRARLVAVGELHRYLYDHADRAMVELKPFLAGLCKAVGAATGLVVDLDADGVSVPGDMAQQLAIAVNEFAINAAKHAYAGRSGGRLSVTCRREGAELVLSVADQGKGLSGDAASGSGLGMSIVAAIVRDLKGALTAQTDAAPLGGARFTIRAPLGPQPLPRSFEVWTQI